MEELSDEILAYKFEYPTVTTSGKELRMILSHPPEKYSSRWLRAAGIAPAQAAVKGSATGEPDNCLMAGWGG